MQCFFLFLTRIRIYKSGSSTSVKTFSRAFQAVFYQGKDSFQFSPWTTTARQFALGEGGGVVTGWTTFFLFFFLFMIVIPFWPAIPWVTLLLLISCGFSDCLSIATRIWQKHNILRIFTLQRSWKLHEQLLSLFSNCTAQYR